MSGHRKPWYLRYIGYLKEVFREVLPVWLLRLLTDWLPEHHFTQRLRGILCRPILGDCAGGLRLSARVTIICPSRLHLGRNVLLVSGTWIDAAGGVWIGDETLIAPGCVITSTSHTAVDGSYYRGPVQQAPTKIGRGCWLAAHVVVKAGVSIGDGVLVGANSVVTKDLPDHVKAGGVPARIIGSSDKAGHGLSPGPSQTPDVKSQS